MSIAYDASSQKSSSAWSSGSSFTWSHVMGNGENRYLVVFFRQVNNNTDAVTGVTFHGVAMSRLYSVGTNWDGTHRMYAYGLANPDSGTYNIVVSLSASYANCSMEAISYTGVKQTGQPDAYGTNNAKVATSVTVSTTTVADNCWIVGAICNSNATSPTRTNFTSRKFNTGTGEDAGDTNGNQTPAGAKNVTESTAASNYWEGITVSLSPYVNPGPANLKSYNTNLKANIKTINTNPIANVKSLDTNV